MKTKKESTIKKLWSGLKPSKSGCCDVKIEEISNKNTSHQKTK
ncbi:hypothetical protein [Gracilibacillus dipsosauri]|nr:hypothetical protein [Gracilibacillus dipsosauri]